MAKRRLPLGSNWAIRARNLGDDIENAVTISTNRGPVMDEIFIDDWFHLEQLTERDWYAYVGGVRLDIHIDKAGKCTVRVNDEETAPEGEAAPHRDNPSLKYDPRQGFASRPVDPRYLDLHPPSPNQRTGE